MYVSKYRLVCVFRLLILDVCGKQCFENSIIVGLFMPTVFITGIFLLYVHGTCSEYSAVSNLIFLNFTRAQQLLSWATVGYNTYGLKSGGGCCFPFLG